MDASHVAYVHIGTLGNGEKDDAIVTLEQRGNQFGGRAIF